MISLTRRSTLKAIAAAIMAPTIQLRQAIPDERLLLAFCNPEPYRLNFEKPFGVGSLTYATDSRAMIRCELTSRVEDGERCLPPNVIDVWDHWWKPFNQWRPLTPDDLRPTEGQNGSCPDCGNRRVSFGENYPDDQVAADALPEWDPDDNTIRDVTCPLCHGRDYAGPSCVRIGNVKHQSWTLKRILALPNPMICDTRGNNGNVGAILFRADGFQGISMGMDES